MEDGEDTGLETFEYGETCDMKAMCDTVLVEEVKRRVSEKPALSNSALQSSGVSEQC